MNISASLAFSQLQRSRSRSITTVLAIALSTALTTAVSSFVASGNALLVELWGEDYGQSGSAYFSMLLVPAVILGILIFTMSVIVISNVFRISAGERAEQFGTLKCVGATGKQIMETVMYESVFLPLIGVPCGILLGVILTYFSIGVANQYLEELNSLVRMMMTEITFTVRFVLSWKALLLAAGISLITVLFSAYLPAKRAARVSAMDSIRRVGTVAITENEERTGWIVNRFFAIEAKLAYKNVKRNRHNTRAAVTSLSISVILFISLGSIKSIVENVEHYIYPERKQTVIVDYVSGCDRRENPETGRTETWYANPIDSERAEEIAELLKAYDDTEFWGIGNEYDTYYVVLPSSYINPQMLEILSEDAVQTQYELDVEIIVLDKANYEALCRKAGITSGGTILLNHYKYNDNGEEEHIVPFSDSMQTITLEKADGTVTEMAIDGVLTRDEIPEELFAPNTGTVRLVVEQASVRGYSWESAPKDIKGYMEYADNVMNEQFPQGATGSYMESGISTRVYEVDDYVRVMNVAIVLASVFLYSFVTLLAVIGFMNVISTMTTNVQMRSREFAMLQSIGMTSQGIRKMLNIESILCSGRALFCGVPIGLAIILMLNFCIRKIFPIPYCIPWKSIGFSIFVVFFIIWSTVRMTARKFRSQNIIETIRNDRI